MGLFVLAACRGRVCWLDILAFVPRPPFAVAAVLGGILPLGFVTCWVAGVVLHELAHYVVARCAGLKVFCLNIGHGPLLWQWQPFGGTIVAIRAVPFSGYVSFSAMDQPRLRWKMFVTTAAGPLANAALAVMGWKLLTHDPYWWTQIGLTDWMHFFLPVFAFINACLVLGTVAPYYETFSKVKMPSDGLQLFKVLFRWDAREWNFSWAKVSETFSPAETSTGSSGKTETLQESVWPNIVNAHDPNWLLPHYREMLNRADMPPDIRPAILDSFATAVLMFDAREYLAEADRYSRELLELKPNEWTVRGTRGSVLIELGRLDEGIAMLMAVVENDPKPFDQAIAAAYIALGELRKGNLENAAEWIQKARTFDPNCVPMKRIASSIGEAALRKQGGSGFGRS